MTAALLTLALVGLPFATAPVAAPTGMQVAEQEQEEEGFDGEVGAGLISTSGNTETLSWNVNLKAGWKGGGWTHEGGLEALRASDAGATTARRVVVSARSRFDLNDSDFLFGSLRYDDDRFSGFDYRMTERGGYGRRLLRDEPLVLDALVGLGSRQSRVEPTGVSVTEFLVYGGAELAWTISDTAGLSEVLSVDIGFEEGTVSKSLTTLTADLVGSLALQLSFSVQHSSEVPPGFEKLDTLTAASLVYSF